MKIAILGFGREGQSVLRFLQNRGTTLVWALTGTRSCADKNVEFWVVDKKSTIKIPAGIQKQLGKNYLKNLGRFDLVFRSPGIPYNLPELKRARNAGVKFSSATKLFFKNCPAKNIIGITGTKGKGTTSTLLYEILRAARKPVFLAGNIGTSPLDILPRLKKNSWVILELSSFQLQDLEKSPHIAAVLDVFPDHQDAHLSLREYYEAKTQIAHHQKRGDKIFFFKNNARSRWIASKSRGGKIAVDPSAWLGASEKKYRLFGPKELKIPGYHNFKNAVMAATMALRLGIAPKTISKVVKSFRGLEHRLEFVRKISGVEFYNDSASTNPQTTAAAIKSFPYETKILIAGGKDKGLDYTPLAKTLKKSNTELVVLFGENKNEIAKAISAIRGQESMVKMVKNLKIAARTAHVFAKSFVISHKSSIMVLFSPGAASFDMFKNYADRGEQFKKFVKKLDI